MTTAEDIVSKASARQLSAAELNLQLTQEVLERNETILRWTEQEPDEDASARGDDDEASPEQNTTTTKDPKKTVSSDEPVKDDSLVASEDVTSTSADGHYSTRSEGGVEEAPAISVPNVVDDDLAAAKAAETAGDDATKKDKQTPGAVAIPGPINTSPPEAEVIMDVEQAPPLNSSTVTATPITVEDLQEEMRDMFVGESVEAKLDTGDDKRGRHLKWWILCGFVLVAVVVGVVVGTQVGGDGGSTPLSLTLSPTLAPTPLPPLSPAEQELMDVLVEVSTFDNGTALEDRSSSQHQAFLSLVPTWKNYQKVEVLERYALSTLYYATDGDSWFQNDKWLTDASTCDWWSVSSVKQCSLSGKLNYVNLDANNLVGTLPPELALLPQTVSLLSFSQNLLEGEVPFTVFEMTNLDTFHLAASGLSGTIDSRLGQLTKLTSLDLSSNLYTGTLPAKALGQLTSLRTLKLEYNENLLGSLPTELGLLTKLQELMTRRVTWEGSIPTELGLCTKLQTLDLAGAASINGTIPEELYNLTELTYLSLTRMGVQGTISTRLGQLVNLDTFDIGRNRLYGTLPDELGLLTDLREFRLNLQNISGTLPTTIGQLTALELLLAKDNNFTGPVPQEIGSMTSLERLVLFHNQFSGSLPDSISNLSNLVAFLCDFNNFSGTVPYAAVANMTELVQFRFHGNRMRGQLPGEEVWSLPNLAEFGVGHDIDGTIPTTIGLATNLRQLFVHSNQLEGSVPTEIGMLTGLTQLAISGNQLTGLLPEELGSCALLEKFYGHETLMQGPIPSSIANWASIDSAYFEASSYSGRMPLCNAQQHSISELFADCEEVVCECCTHCCTDGLGCVFVGEGEDPSEEDRPIGVFVDVTGRPPSGSGQ